MKRWRLRITVDLERRDEDEADEVRELTPAVSSFGFEVPRPLSRDDDYEWDDAQ